MIAILLRLVIPILLGFFILFVFFCHLADWLRYGATCRRCQRIIWGVGIVCEGASASRCHPGCCPIYNPETSCDKYIGIKVKP